MCEALPFRGSASSGIGERWCDRGILKDERSASTPYAGNVVTEPSQYLAAETRYDSIVYNRVGRSGLKLPGLSLIHI